jgi:DNA-binding NtrC family response regulator
VIKQEAEIKQDGFSDDSRIQIMVVDDELAIRNSLTAFLEDCDFDVTAFGTAEEAMELIEDSGSQPFHVVIVDLRLPGMSGDKMIPKIAKRFPAICFLIHTGSATFKLTEELTQLGMKKEHILRKPIDDLGRVENLIYKIVGKEPENG